MAAPPSWAVRLYELGRGHRKISPVKLPRPLVLGNQVSNRRMRLGEATCITEMSLMMACWKQNEFSDTVCDKEIQTFFDCAAKSEAERKEKIRQESLGGSGHLNGKQINKLLQRFPNITHHY